VKEGKLDSLQGLRTPLRSRVRQLHFVPVVWKVSRIQCGLLLWESASEVDTLQCGRGNRSEEANKEKRISVPGRRMQCKYLYRCRTITETLLYPYPHSLPQLA